MKGTLVAGDGNKFTFPSVIFKFCLSFIFSFSLVTGMSSLGDIVCIACHVSVIVHCTMYNTHCPSRVNIDCGSCNFADW